MENLIPPKSSSAVDIRIRFHQSFLTKKILEYYYLQKLLRSTLNATNERNS